MDFDELKKLIEKGIKGSAEKQLEVFMENKKTQKYFKKAIKGFAK